MKYKKLLLFTLFIIFFSFVIIPIKVSSQFADINYEFQKDTLYTNEGIKNQFNEIFNLRNQTYMDLGNYPATYSFTDDGTFSAVDWTFGQDGGRVIVNSEIKNHKKVLDLYDTSNIDIVNAFTVFPLQTSENTILEFWILSNDTSQYSWFAVREGGTSCVFIAFITGMLRYNDGSWNTILDPAENNVWYHIKIIIDIPFDTFDLWLNGLKIIDDGGLINDITLGINGMMISTDGSSLDYRVFIDAIGFSWNIQSYNDLFDFSNDTIGNEPLNWNINNGVGCTTLISSSLDSRTKILNLTDTHTSRICNISKDIIIFTSQSIQLDIAINDLTTNENYFRFYEGNTLIVDILLQANDLYNYDGGYNPIDTNFIDLNTFFTFKIDFNHVDDTSDIYINNILEGNDLNYRNSATLKIDSLNITTSTETPFDYSLYFDNIYINSIFYEVGSNIFPLTIETNYLEIDKYEFALSDANTLYPDGYSGNVRGWTLFDESPHMFTNIRVDEFNDDDPNDRVIEMFIVDEGWVSGIEKSQEIAGMFFKISADFLLAEASGFGGSTVIFGIGHNAEKIAYLNISFASGIPAPEIILSYESDSGFIELRDDIIIGGNYTFELIINYEIDIVFFNYFVNDILIETYIFPTINTGHEGIDTISLFGFSGGGDNILLVDSIGIYSEEIPQTSSFGWSSIDMNKDNWNYEHNNLFFLNASGYFHLGTVVAPIYTVGETMREFEGFQTYNETFQLRNVFDEYISDITDPMIIMTIQNHNFSLNYINIEGAKMIESDNEYFLVFSHGNINVDNSYFYVDDNNKLQFIHNSDDSNIEYIQANFNIDDIITNDSTIGFTSRKDNNAIGYFRLKFESTSNVYVLPSFVNSRKILLTSGKTIDEFVILISDEGLSGIEGITTGYITSISIQYAPAIIISVVTLNLIGVLVPLMIILIPTIAISEYYGKSLFIPSFMLFTIILGITGLIPLWLFFTTILSCSVFIFTKKEKELI